jgi:sRNA-binding protein
MAKASKQRVVDVLNTLAERFPLCFTYPRKPLKCGIKNDIVEAVGDTLTATDIGTALACYTGSSAYLKAVIARRPRVDLNGNQCDKPTDLHSEKAKQRLKLLNAKRCGSGAGRVADQAPAVPKAVSAPTPEVKAQATAAPSKQQPHIAYKRRTITQPGAQ